MALSPPTRESTGMNIDIEKFTFEMRQTLNRRRDLCSTDALVSFHNKPRTEDSEDKILRQTVSGFIRNMHAWFHAYKKRLFTAEIIQEYAILAKIKTRTTEEKNCLRNAFDILKSHLNSQECGFRRDYATALTYFIGTVDLSIFDDCSELYKLQDALLAELAIMPYDRSTYPTKGSFLQLLDQTIVTLEQKSGDEIKEGTSLERIQRIQATVEDIKNKATYYPLKFHANMILQRIKLVAKESAENRSEIVASVSAKLTGFLRSVPFIRSAIFTDVKPITIEEAAETIKNAITATEVSDSKWFMHLSVITNANLQAIANPEKMELFNEQYRLAIDDATIKNKESKRPLLYGLLEQLRIAAVCEHTIVRANALYKLRGFVTDTTIFNRWYPDKEICEAIFESLQIAASGQNMRDRVLKIFNDDIRTSGHVDLKDAFNEWLGDDRVEQKIPDQGSSSSSPPKTLFDIVAIESGLLLTPEQKKQNIKQLREAYSSEEFTKVTCGSNHTDFDVRNFKHSLVPESLDQTDPNQQKEEVTTDDVVTMLEKDEVKKIAIFGRPGMGKTCISLKIPHEWAIRPSDDPKFEFVFRVSANDFDSSKYDSRDARHYPSLEAVIANKCFPRKKDDEIDALQHQVQDAFVASKTLIIVDEFENLDERKEFESTDDRDRFKGEMIKKLLQCDCKLLLLSRPYNCTRAQADCCRKLVCAGFNEAQMTEMIRERFPNKHGEYTRILHEHPFLKEIAVVPLNMVFFCNKLHNLDKDGSETCPFDVLCCIVRSWLDRYANQLAGDREVVCTILSNIAKRTNNCHEDKRSAESVTTYAETSCRRKELKKSGLIFPNEDGQEYVFPYKAFRDFFVGSDMGKCLSREVNPNNRPTVDTLSKYKHEADWNDRIMISMLVYCKAITVPDFSVVSDAFKKRKEIGGVYDSLQQLKIMEVVLAAMNTDSVENFQEQKAVQDLILEVSNEIVAFMNDEAVVRWIANCLSCLRRVRTQFEWMLDDLMEEIEKLSASGASMKLGCIATLVQHEQDHVTRVMDIFKKNIGVDDEDVRLSYLQQASEMYRTIPGEADELVELVCKRFTEDDEPSAKEEALTQLAEIVCADSCVREEIWQTAIKASEHENMYIREASVPLIGKIADIDADKRSAVIDRLKELLTADPYKQARSAALDQLCSTQLAHSINTGECMDYIREGISSGSEEEYGTAMTHIPTVLSKLPQYKDELLSLLGNGCRHEDSKIREAATLQLGKLAKLLPESVTQLIELAEMALQSEADVGKAAVLQIELFASLDNDLDLGGLFKAALEHDSEIIRAEAFVQKALLLQSKSDTDALKTLLLDEWLPKTESVIRTRFFDTLPEILKAVPPETEKLLDVVVKACEDVEESIKATALRCLRELPVKALLDCYWKTKSEYIVSALVDRLPQTIISKDSAGNPRKAKLVVCELESSTPIESERKISEVKDLVKKLTEGYHLKYPNLAQSENAE